MNQPDLGLKVVELRQEKGLTPEQLEEMCEVSPRTIQRIESGEVDPRAYSVDLFRLRLWRFRLPGIRSGCFPLVLPS